MFILHRNVLGDQVDSIFAQITTVLSFCFAMQWRYFYKQYFKNIGIAFWITNMLFVAYNDQVVCHIQWPIGCQKWVSC